MPPWGLFAVFIMNLWCTSEDAKLKSAMVILCTIVTIRRKLVWEYSYKIIILCSFMVRKTTTSYHYHSSLSLSQSFSVSILLYPIFPIFVLHLNCSDDYWIGLAQVNGNSSVYWVDGTQHHGSYISAGGDAKTKCMKANVENGKSVEFEATGCGVRKRYICEDVVPPGKWAYQALLGRIWIANPSLRLTQDEYWT